MYTPPCVRLALCSRVFESIHRFLGRLCGVICRELSIIELNDQRASAALRKLSMCDQPYLAAAEKLVEIAEAPETGSHNDTVHEEAFMLHEGVRRRHNTSIAPGGLINRLSNELYGPKVQPQASLRRADWQQMTQKETKLDKPSKGTPISHGVGGIAGGVLFHAIVVDVLRYYGRGLCFGPFPTAIHPRTDPSVSSWACGLLGTFMSCSPTRRPLLAAFHSQA